MAQIKFYRGERSLFFNEGVFKTDYENAICFLSDNTIVVNGVEYGMSETLKGYLHDGKVLTGVSYADYKLSLSFADGTSSEVDINIPTVSNSVNGLMLAEDKVKLDTISEALVGEDGKIVEATSEHAGLMTAAQVALLLSLDGSGSGEGADAGILTRMANAEGSIVILQGEMDTVEGKVSTLEGDVKAIKEDIGEWSSTTESIAEAIGGLEGRVSANEAALEVLNGEGDGSVKKAEADAKAHAEGLVNALSATVDGVKADVDAFLNAAEVGDAAVDTLKEIQSYITSDLAAADEMVKNIAANAKAIEDEVKNREDAVAALQALVEANAGNIEAVTTQAGTNASAIEALQAQVKALSEDTTNADAIAALAERVDALEKDDTLAKAVEALEGRMGTAENGISANASAIEALQALVAANGEAISGNADAISELAERVKGLEDSTVCQEAIEAVNDRVDAAEARIEDVEEMLVWNEVKAAE